MEKLFSLGKIYITQGVKKTIDMNDVYSALERHQSGDFGSVSQQSIDMNTSAIKNNDDYILSIYEDKNNREFWINTQYDKKATTILLPEEN